MPPPSEGEICIICAANSRHTDAKNWSQGQMHFPYLERVQGVLDGVPRGPVGPPGPPELAAPLLALSLYRVLLAVQLTLKVGLAFIFVQQVLVAQQRAEIAQGPTAHRPMRGRARRTPPTRRRCAPARGPRSPPWLGFLSAGRRTPSAQHHDHALLRSEVEVRGRKQPLQLRQPRT